MERKTEQEFLSQLNEIFKDKNYDYSKLHYVNRRTKVIIICPKHGEFQKTPKDLLKGEGCPFCAGNRRKTTEEFISSAKKIYGDEYDYSKVTYVNNKTKVEITHKVCGNTFLQRPNDHLSGYRCPFCYRDFPKTTEQFINEATEIYGDKYDYSLVNYVNNKTKVEIICKNCGSHFFKKPEAHLQLLQGCPNCPEKMSSGEFKIASWLDKNNIKYIYNKPCLKFLGKLRPDFYLQDYNMVLEYDGEQHYLKEVEKIFGRSLEEIQYYDRLKNRLCFENDVVIQRIPYWNYSKIDEILNEIFL